MKTGYLFYSLQELNLQELNCNLCFFIICQVIVWLKNLKFDFLLSNLFLNIWLFVVLHYMIDEKVFRIQFRNMKSVFLFWLNLVYFVCFCNYGRVGKYTWYQLGLFSIKLKLMLWLILDLSIFPTYLFIGSRGTTLQVLQNLLKCLFVAI